MSRLSLIIQSVHSRERKLPEQQIPSARAKAELSSRSNPYTQEHTYAHAHEENKSLSIYFCSLATYGFTTDANQTESLLANRYQKK